MKALLLAVLLMTRLLTAASLELVQSVPQESSLAQPGLRTTAEAWLELINSSRESLCIEQFYISDGRADEEGAGKPGSEAMAPILAAVEGAAERGVRVRIIVEEVFVEKYPHTIAALDSVEGIAVRILAFGKLAGGIQHGKFIIADQSRAYVGSANWDWRALTQIHELGVLFHEEFSAGWIQQLFDLDWDLCQMVEGPQARRVVPIYPDPFPVSVGDALLTPVASPPGWIPSESLWNANAILRLLDRAESSIRIQLLSYGLVGYDGKYWDSLDRGLRRASQRGVEVELLLSDWTLKEKHLPWLRSLALLPNISIRISSIPAHSRAEIAFARVEHCKYALVDERAAWLGSANWEGDYFNKGRNLGLVIEGGVIPAQLAEIFQRSWNGDWSTEFRGCE